MVMRSRRGSPAVLFALVFGEDWEKRGGVTLFDTIRDMDNKTTIFKQIWDILPSLLYIAGGVISFLASIWTKVFGDWEMRYPKTIKGLGVVLSIGLVMAGISDMQQRKNQVTKDDLNLYEGKITKSFTDVLGTKMDKFPIMLESAFNGSISQKELKLFINNQPITNANGRNMIFSDFRKDGFQISFRNESKKTIQNMTVRFVLRSKGCKLYSDDPIWREMETPEFTSGVVANSRDDQFANPGIAVNFPIIKLQCNKSDSPIEVGELLVSLKNASPVVYPIRLSDPVNAP